MPSAFREPKTLPDWIELDYHQRSRWLRRWQTWLTFGTLLIGAVVALGYAFTPWGRRSYQAGPLSSGHALFANDCAQCHTQAFKTTQRFIDPTVATVPDAACVRCHAGAVHNASSVHDGEAKRCSECHHEHHGLDRLALVPDNECTICHADLKSHSKREPPLFENVRGFPNKHPALAMSPAKGHPCTGQDDDPGHLFFNHQAHLKEQSKARIADGNGSTRALECIDCHRTDQGRIVAGQDSQTAPHFILPQLPETTRVDEAGQYLQPIRYESHCKACHPLSVQLSGVFTEEAKAKEAVESFRTSPLPHPGKGQSAETVRGVIRDRLFDLLQGPTRPGRAQPAERPGVPRAAATDVSEKQWTWVREKMLETDALGFWKEQAKDVADGQFRLSGGCRLCHEVTEPKAPGSLPGIVPPDLPLRWWAHSRFSHERHRMMKCTECHDKAPTSTQTKDVLLPKNLDLCARCHSAEARGSAAARHDCIECHLYHPHQRADPDEPRTLEQLLGK